LKIFIINYIISTIFLIIKFNFQMSSDEHVNEQKYLDDVSIDSESFIEIRKFSEDEKKEEKILVKVNDFKTSCNM
jgi:hypothetical protein